MILQRLAMRTLLLTVAVAALAVAAAGAEELRPPRLPQFHFLEPRVTDVEAGALERSNAFRRANGLASLAENPALTLDARDFAAYLARTGAFSHTADGRDPAQRARAAGYDWCELAENLAYEEDSRGFESDALAELLVHGWEESPSHRRNLLNPRVTEIGLGVAKSPREPGKYVAVQVFGQPASARLHFSVINRSGLPVSYSFEGRRQRLDPGVVAAYDTCSTSALSFDFTRSAVQVEPGASYVVRRGPDGVRIVEVLRPAAARSSRPGKST